MKRIALPAGLLLVVMLACFAMLRARAQDEPAKQILADDPPVPTLPNPLQPPLPDAIDPVSPTDPLLIDPPPLDPPRDNMGFDPPQPADQPTETSIATVQVVLQQIGLKPITVGDELFCIFKTTYNNRDWKFSISAKVPTDSQTVELYAWLNKYPAAPSDAETLQVRALKINYQQFFDDAIVPHEFRFRDHRLTLCRVLNAGDCEQTRRLAREIQTLAGMVVANYSSWSEIGTPILSQSEEAQATSDAIDPVSCQPAGPPNLTTQATDGYLSVVDPPPPQVSDDSFDHSEPDPDRQPALKVQIVHLRTLPAADAAITLQSVFHDGQAIIAADERSNSIILRGREEDLQELIALLERLDSADSARPKKTPARRAPSDHELLLEKRVLEFKTFLAQARAGVADKNTPDPDERLAVLADQIRSTADRAFNERQRQQLAEIEELSARLNKLAKAVREREAKREAIINQRISQLIGANARGEDPSTKPGFSQGTGMGVIDTTSGMGGKRSGSGMGMPGMGGVEMGGVEIGDFRPSAIPDPATTYEGTIDFDGQSQGLNLVDLAEKFHSLRKSIASELDGIELLKQRLSTFESNPDNVRKGADTGLSKLLRKLTVALQQKRAELATYKQLLSIEIDAAQGEHFRTTQELNRVRLLHEEGAVPTRQVLDADGAAAKSNTALVRLKVLMGLIQNIEHEATPAEPESPASESKRDDLAPKVDEENFNRGL